MAQNVPTQVVPVGRRHGAGRSGVLEVALRLFVERGVSGTSLQMIADELGVTKAAVYYHFKTKDDLVIGVITPVLERLRSATRAGDGQVDPELRRWAVLVALIDLLVDLRTVFSSLTNDPTISRIGAEMPWLEQASREVFEVFAGPESGDEVRVSTTVFLTGLTGPLSSPLCSSIDDERLRALLLDTGRRFLGIPMGVAVP